MTKRCVALQLYRHALCCMKACGIISQMFDMFRDNKCNCNESNANEMRQSYFLFYNAISSENRFREINTNTI